MAEFSRPQDGFRFIFGGVNTKEVPDALPADKYQAVLNVRATAEQSIRTRPGYQLYFTANNNQNNNAFTPAPITDIRAYTTLGNNAFPRLMARDENGRVFLDTGRLVGNLNGNAGVGVSMNPFRPKESATPWMYIAGLGDYQRFSAPDANNNVVQRKVGIAEPQVQVLAQAQPPNWQYLGPGNTLLWPAGGNNATATANVTRSAASVATTPLTDPVQTTRQSLIINANNAYGIGQVLDFYTAANLNFQAIVEDVIPAVANGANLNINALRYWGANNNGPCTIFIGQLPDASNISGVIQGVRRGMVARLNHSGGLEYVLVREAVYGANGIVAINTSTSADWTALNGNVSLLATMVINSNSNAVSGQNMNSTGMTANLSAGISTISHNMVGANSFARVNGVVPQEDDYIHMSVMFSDPTQLVQLLLLFYLDTPLSFGTGGNILYYAVRPSDLVQVVSGNQQIVPAILDAAEAQLIGLLPNAENITPPSQASPGNNMWTELMIPISSLQRIGSDLTKSLSSAVGFQLQVNVAGNTTFGWSSFWNGAGKGPDVGNNGSPYKYLCVPMNSNTGVVGNPTPIMRYGVGPRRQGVVVQTANLNTAYDPQIDTWAVYRTGGSVTPVSDVPGILSPYRFIGSTPTGNNYIDTLFDDAAAVGAPVEIDNTEPWPTIDQPWRFAGGGANAYGQWLVLSGVTGMPASMNRWLPGTLFQVGLSNDVFTLRSRPVVSGNSITFEFDECIGAGSQSSIVFVLEPNVANQPLPYVWGPNEYGHFFGAGDPLRPSSVYWCKKYAPDSAASKSNLELCQPSEPMMGGKIIKGVSMVASSLRWWYLNYQSGSDRQQYVQVEAPVGKRLASPYGMDSDGTDIFFWAEDCIARTGGGKADSLTDDDLYNIFPHGGLAGVDVVTNGVTYYAPDYSRAAQFRLTYRNGMLYALYPDTTGAFRMIVYDVLRKAWSQDAYADTMRTAYSIEQPKTNLAAAANNNTLYPNLMLGDNNGKIWQVKDLINDGVIGANVGTPISGMVATREFNAGDARSDSQFGDLFLDGSFPFGANATPIVQGVGLVDANNNNIVQVISANNNRQFVAVSVGGAALQNFLGLRVNWTDNFYTGNNNLFAKPTQLNVWQPSYVDKPEVITTRFGDTVNFGGACYVRGVTIYADTLGANKSIKIRNFDNNTLVPLQSVLSANNTASYINHNGEQEINYWFNPPFVAHMVRDESQDALPWRKFGEFEYLYDKWPELTDLPSPWMNVRDTGQAGFLQGLILPLEVGDGNNATLPELKIRVDHNGTLIDLISYVRPIFNVKTGVAYALTVPTVCHQVQIIPQAPCRVWWNEIQFKAEATPDLGTHWITQWLGFGIKGYKSIPRIEMAYSAQSSFTLTIETFDGTDPVAIEVPGSGGEQAKVLLTMTFNKGMLYRFSAVSGGTFQIFMEDCLVWVYEWGRLGPAVDYRLGAEFGDKATI